MAGWPPDINYALQELDNHYPGDELSIEVFVSIWGGLERDHLLRAINEGEGDEDTLLAILALAYDESSSTRELLIPLLQSVYPKVRWISAYCLGKMKDERALPALAAIVTETVLPSEEDLSDERHLSTTWFYEQWHPVLTDLFNTWKSSK